MSQLPEELYETFEFPFNTYQCKFILVFQNGKSDNKPTEQKSQTLKEVSNLIKEFEVNKEEKEKIHLIFVDEQKRDRFYGVLQKKQIEDYEAFGYNFTLFFKFIQRTIKDALDNQVQKAKYVQLVKQNNKLTFLIGFTIKNDLLDDEERQEIISIDLQSEGDHKSLQHVNKLESSTQRLYDLENNYKAVMESNKQFKQNLQKCEQKIEQLELSNAKDKQELKKLDECQQQINNQSQKKQVVIKTTQDLKQVNELNNIHYFCTTPLSEQIHRLELVILETDANFSVGIYQDKEIKNVESMAKSFIFQFPKGTLKRGENYEPCNLIQYYRMQRTQIGIEVDTQKSLLTLYVNGLQSNVIRLNRGWGDFSFFVKPEGDEKLEDIFDEDEELLSY